jgi:DNA-binding GntR family transcriptional regulator
VAAERPNDFEALEAANRNFHAVILERELNLPAIEAMERNAGIINATRAKLPVTLSRLRQRIAQHREIVEAIAAEDPEAAGRVAIEHVRSAGEDLLQQMRQARTIGVRVASFMEPAARGAAKATAETAT